MRILLFTVLVLAALPVSAQTGNGSGADVAPADATERSSAAATLKTPDDWYDCAAFFIILSNLEHAKGAGIKKVRGFIALKWAAQAKGEALARGSDAVPPPEAFDLSTRTYRDSDGRVQHFLEKHTEQLKEGGEAAGAHVQNYIDHCMPPTIALAKEINRQAARKKGQTPPPE